MADFLYVLTALLFFVACWAFTKVCDKALGGSVEYIVAGITTVLLFAYLLYALLRPEKF